MTRLRRLFAVATILFVAACAAPQPPVVVSFIDTITPSQTATTKLAQVQKFNGSFAAAPLHNIGALDNPAVPNGTTSFEDRLITFSQFRSAQDQAQFIAQTVNDTAVTAQYLAVPMENFPLISDIAPISAVDRSTDPAFVLVNGIKMRSMLNPATPVRMIRYMSNNTPKIEQLGVEVISPLRVKTKTKGPMDLDLLFLTLWPDETTFDALHSDPNFIQLAQSTRNKAFKSFTDDKAQLIHPN